LLDIRVICPVRRSLGVGRGVGVFVVVEPVMVRVSGGSGWSLGIEVLDRYLEFVAGRCRPNTVRATAFDLKIFFAVVAKPVEDVRAADVFGFIRSQRGMAGKVVSLDGSSGLSPRTVQRRLSSVSGLYAFLLACETPGIRSNPVPRGLSTRREQTRGRRGVPLLRTPRVLPRVLSVDDVGRLRAALRTDRDRAMVEAMVLGGLRRCEVLGLRLTDLHLGDRQVFVVEGKGGHQRLIPMSAQFFGSVGRYLDRERPADAATERVFVVLKGPRRGLPLSLDGLDQVMQSARGRAGLIEASCHQLRHTCFTRLRQAGMSLEAIQAQAGHASIETTRIYLHLADDWLAGEYRRASEAIDAQLLDGHR
jgi:integrase/recombinase XerD